jgi:hypothetical protein
MFSVCAPGRASCERERAENLAMTFAIKSHNGMSGANIEVQVVERDARGRECRCAVSVPIDAASFFIK